jgi:DtxR family Mn-dependent transcriptional regulator
MPPQGHSVDEYLETIYFLAFPIGEYRPQDTALPTLASRVAEMLGVSRASAGEMLKRLEGEGLVERGEHKEAILTPAGRVRAEKVVRKHRIIERLLTDFMGYTAAEAHVHADELGGTFSDDMVERIDERLGHPDRCPHGWPVDPDFEQAENRQLEPLSALEHGTQRPVVRLAAPDGDLFALVLRRGLAPGTEIELRARQPGRRPVPDRARRPRDGDRREGRRRAVRQAVAVAAPIPAAPRSASAFSVGSHVKSWSSQPKWPYEAVLA